MKKSLFPFLLNLIFSGLIVACITTVQALETMPDLNIMFHIENSAKKVKSRGASVYTKAGIALSQAEDMQDRIDTMLQIRHMQERMASEKEYVTFVCHAVQTAARATMQEIITVLDTIEQSITYWRSQQGHQVHYAFHKNPAKLIVGKKQKAEIREHLDTLYALQKTYFTHLGTIAEQLQDVAAVCGQVGEQPTTMHRVAQALSTVVGIPHTAGSVVNADMLIDETVKVLYQVPLYLKRAHRVLKAHTVPSWAARNWLPVGVAAVGSAALIYSYLQMKHNAHTWIDDKQTKIKPEIDKATRAALDLTNQIDEKLQKGNKTLTDVGIKTMHKLNTLLQKDGTIDQAGLAVGEKMTKVEVLFEREGAATTGFLNLWQLPGGALMSSQFAAIYNLLGYKTDKDENGNQINKVEKLGNKVRKWRDSAVETAKKVGTFAGQKAPNYAQKIENTIKGAQRGVHMLDETIVDVAPKISNGIDTTARVSKNMVTYGLPIVGLATLYCGYKVTKSLYQAIYPLLFPTPNYEYVQTALRDMSRLFNNNEHAAALSIEDRGALVYHVHTLRSADIPGELQDQFTADVAELTSPQFTLAQKLRTIDRMYRNYDFLTVGC